MVTVISGANEVRSELAGSTVEDAREQFAQGLSIPGNAKAQVNGRPVQDDYELRSGDRLVFAAATAEKG